MKKTCLIITGGEIDLDFAGGFCKSHPFDKLIAVDGGLAPVKAPGSYPKSSLSSSSAGMAAQLMEIMGLSRRALSR